MKQAVAYRDMSLSVQGFPELEEITVSVSRSSLHIPDFKTLRRVPGYRINKTAAIGSYSFCWCSRAHEPRRACENHSIHAPLIRSVSSPLASAPTAKTDRIMSKQSHDELSMRAPPREQTWLAHLLTGLSLLRSLCKKGPSKSTSFVSCQVDDACLPWALRFTIQGLDVRRHQYELELFTAILGCLTLSQPSRSSSQIRSATHNLGLRSNSSTVVDKRKPVTLVLGLPFSSRPRAAPPASVRIIPPWKRAEDQSSILQASWRIYLALSCCKSLLRVPAVAAGPIV
ncbi:hypothetical protein HZ326_0514 [Fusarium oxysporum f. sp. albedinis]|nr:hypothetical protein HZ326_0514 [Fusarium oxysporum f. sp. albedinis]